jgi:hypothetical protein
MSNVLDDERLAAIDADREADITASNTMYDDLAKEYQTTIDNQAAELDTLQTQQVANQNAATEFEISKINQQKAEKQTDYTKEQSASYKDWQKESNRYGVEAENMAQSGLTNTGYGESSQVRMYTAYQNRVAVAKESFDRAMVSYDNAITEARLQNSVALAQIASDTFAKKTELILTGLGYRSELLSQKVAAEREINSLYDTRYRTMLDQINEENRMAESSRQFDAEMELAREEAEKDRAFQAEEAAKERAHEVALVNLQNGNGSGNASIMNNSGTSTSNSGILAKNQTVQIENDILGTGTKNFWEDNATIGSALYAPGSPLYTYDLYARSKSGSSATKNESANANANSNKEYQNMEVTTNYYRGKLNQDAYQYGTFDNGYQPKGIFPYGEVTKVQGMTINVNTKYVYGPNAGKAVTVQQNVWETPDGRLWYWNGVENKYESYYKLKQ